MASKAEPGTGGSWLRLVLGAVTCLLVAAPACSGDDHPSPAHLGAGGGGGGGTGGVVSGGCSTEGEVRDCHFKVNQHDGFLNCFAGQQECRGGFWSPCAGNVTLSSHALQGTSFEGSEGTGPALQPQSYTDAGPSDASTACTLDPCNPYCLGYDEDPPNITPPVTSLPPFGDPNEWGNGPSGFQNKENCGWTSPATTPKCNDPYIRACGGENHYNMFDGCQADHHCDTTTGQCVRSDFTWKWPPAICPGVDLTLGPACIQNLGQGAKEGFLMCNRGNTNVAAGTTIEVRFDNSASLVLLNCNGSGNKNCDVALPSGLKAGSCVRVVDSAPLASPWEVGPCGNGVWQNGNIIAMVNPQQANAFAYPECGIPMASPATSATMPGCSDNWSDVKKGGVTCTAEQPPDVYSGQTVSTTYVASCPPGTKPTWDKLAWDSIINCNPGACNGTNESSMVFTAQTAPASAPTSWVPAVATTLATVRSGKPAVCPMSGVAGCPVDVYNLLGGKPIAENANLKLTITLNPSPNQYSAPTLNSWQVTYSCPPAE